MTIGFVVALIAVSVGAIIQGSLGFGFSLVAVPAMMLLHPEAVPATILFMALPMNVIMAIRERGAIDAAGFGWITGGRLMGTLAGIGLLAAVPAHFLSELLGCLVVVAVCASLIGPTFAVGKTTQLVGGIASGVMSTAAALGGPPLALINQRRSGPELRSTLAISFLVGILMSIGGLILAGKVDEAELVLALQLLPGVLAGLLVSRWLAGLLDKRWLRPAILIFAAAAGVAVIILGPVG